MSLHARKSRLLAGLYALIAVAGLIGAPPARAATADLHESVRATMLAERGDVARRGFGTSQLAEPLIEPNRNASDWAFGSVTIPAPMGVHATPETALFLANRSGDGWRVALDGTAGFAELSASAPVLSADEKSLFAKNFAAAGGQAPVDTGLGLPWPVGVAWWMGGGPHGNSGQSRPFSSIDFNGGDGRVLSAGDGRVYKSCVRGRSALVKVVHPNGYSTTYYHMYDLTTLPDGSAVRTGTYLGHIGNELPCGGSSSGAHVHFSLLRGDSHVTVDDKTIGGWTFQEGTRAYSGYAERNGTRVGVGGRITNYGASGEPGRPTGVVNSGQNPSVNLRSGPGLSYDVVGTVANGAVVTIACTARGDYVDGVWGRTNLWNKLDTGSWISDGFVDTGSNEPVAPACVQSG